MNPQDSDEIQISAVPPPDERVVQAIALTISAAQMARQWRATHVGPAGGPVGASNMLTPKTSSTDLVTEADKAVEEWLVQQIARYHPADQVLGEEGGQRSTVPLPDQAARWIIDPIDGTVNFVLGIPHYAVSIAIEVGDQVKVACVVNVATQTLYWAVAGEGAWLVLLSGDESTAHFSDSLQLARGYATEPHLRGRRLHGPRSIDLGAAVIGTGFGYDRIHRGRQALVAANLLPQVADIRRFGAASLDLCAVAEGTLDGYYEAGLSPWDFAAGALIAAEAGCETSGLHNRPCSSTFTAAAGPTLAPELFSLLEDLNADLQ